MRIARIAVVAIAAATLAVPAAFAQPPTGLEPVWIEPGPCPPDSQVRPGYEASPIGPLCLYQKTG